MLFDLNKAYKQFDRDVRFDFEESGFENMLLKNVNALKNVLKGDGRTNDYYKAAAKLPGWYKEFKDVTPNDNAYEYFFLSSDGSRIGRGAEEIGNFKEIRRVFNSVLGDVQEFKRRYNREPKAGSDIKRLYQVYQNLIRNYISALNDCVRKYGK